MMTPLAAAATTLHQIGPASMLRDLNGFTDLPEFANGRFAASELPIARSENGKVFQSLGYNGRMQMLVPGQASTDYRQVVGNIRERVEHLIAKPWLPHVVNAAVLVLLTASLAQWTWLLISPKTPQVVVAPPAAVNQTAPAVNVQAILGANLFGVAPAAVGTGNIENIPLSSLNLVLTGLVAAGDASYALIRVEGQPEAPFGIGEVITAGAVLQAVYADRAIISRGGVAESLLLEGAAQPLPGSIPSPAPPRASNQSASVPDVREQGPNNYVVSREALTTHMRSNPQKVLSQSLMVPNAGGGFLVREIQPGSIYDKLGLRAGDVVRTANGQTLNTLEDVMQLYQQSDQNNYINLEIVRNGRPEVLQYTLQ